MGQASMQRSSSNTPPQKAQNLILRLHISINPVCLGYQSLQNNATALVSNQVLPAPDSLYLAPG